MEILDKLSAAETRVAKLLSTRAASAGINLGKRIEISAYDYIEFFS
tara:strand:+ start:72 stop:209 length:138 start_codon:yes stop_codon:yes gene_type:complete